MNKMKQKRMNTKYVGHHVSSGGFIFYKKKGGEDISVLLIKNNKGEYWIPKGHIEENEDQITASFREIEEEVGLKKEQLNYIGLCHIHKYSFLDKNGKESTKEVYMNVFQVIEKLELKLEQVDTEIQSAGWFKYEDARNKIIPYSKNELIKAKEMFEQFINKKNEG